ncbi:efflux transporter outer membrane subunit [Aliidiomarina maris]|uniref:Multidrug efflux system outer membrane protein n=1 Tax=Aliidiomarina maris TaxID=531312 RepID=A0A327X6Z9_9GAMM|nr:efflux transporter outer membrane subunit [Aliidiomarina maris]MCL5049044.1 efflux transporter outer membrane subunit [Bacillota bacterium]RAK01432.1 multidrug efflux system outer membrane protein [Aliidiomarina maris]RUO28272.1 RND transporter [Aliidiomarina maris]
MRNFRTSCLALSLSVALAGCAMGPNYQSLELDLAEQFPEHQIEAQSTEQDWLTWWRQFNDPNLNALVERALDDSLELQLQLQRIEQARAQLGLSNAEFWPTLGAQAEATRTQQPAVLLPPEFGGGTPRNQFSVAGSLSYELDLWGRVRREREAAGALLEQSVYGAQAVRLNIIADVVTTYFNMRALEQQVAVTERSIDNYAQSLQLMEVRYEAGAIDPLSLRQARAMTEGARAALPDLQEALATTRSALAMLVGYSEQEMLGQLDFGATQLSDIALPEQLPAVLPSELLQRRPDVRAAESYMVAANAQIGAAQASRFPTLNLNAMLGTTALETGDLFASGTETWSLGGNLAGPLFDFGRGRLRVESAQAASDQAQTQYRQAVLGALRDSRDALTMHYYAQQRTQAVRRQTTAVVETVEFAQLQYDAGAIGYFELLDAQREQLNAELTLAQAESQRFIAAANLFKAMGGGWSIDSTEGSND